MVCLFQQLEFWRLCRSFPASENLTLKIIMQITSMKLFYFICQHLSIIRLLYWSVVDTWQTKYILVAVHHHLFMISHSLWLRRKAIWTGTMLELLSKFSIAYWAKSSKILAFIIHYSSMFSDFCYTYSVWFPTHNINSKFSRKNKISLLFFFNSSIQTVVLVYS